MNLRMGPYLRVSDDKSDRLKSVADQEHDYENDRRDNPQWAEVDRYREAEAVSASPFANGKARPEFVRLVADIRAGRLDAIWVWDVSRLLRDLEVWIPLRKLCRAKRIKLYGHTEGRMFDFGNPEHVRGLDRKAMDAEHYSGELSDKIHRASRTALREGTPWGRCPYGYVRDYNPRTGKLLRQRRCETYGPIVEELFGRYAAGEDVSKIARDLTARRVAKPSDVASANRTGEKPKPTQWGQLEITRIVTCATYLGQRTTKHSAHATEFDGPIIGQWPALVSAERFAQCQARKGVDRARGPRLARPGKARWLLSYLAVCVNGHHARVRTAEGLYDCVPGCFTAPVSAVDDVVIAVFGAWASDPVNWDAVMLADADPAVIEAREEAFSLRLELAEWNDLAAQRKIRPTVYAEHEQRLLPLIADAERRSTSATVPGPVAALFRSVAERAMSAEATFRDLDVAIQRQVIGYLFEVTIHRGARATTGDRRRVIFRPELVKVKAKFVSAGHN